LKQPFSSSSGQITGLAAHRRYAAMGTELLITGGTYGSDPSLKTPLRGSMKAVSRRQVSDCRNRRPSPRCGLSRDPDHGPSLHSLGPQGATLGGAAAHSVDGAPASTHVWHIVGPLGRYAAHNVDSCFSYGPLSGLRASSDDLKIRKRRKTRTKDLNQKMHVVL
jgi:hypothetical protein